MREHGKSRLAQYLIAKWSRNDEQAENKRRGCTLAELNARQRATDNDAQGSADRVLRNLTK